MSTTVAARFSLVRSRKLAVHAGAAEVEQAPANAPAPQAPALSRAFLRTALVVGSLVAGVVGGFAASGASQPTEPELAVLLRGMSVLKGLMAAAAFGLVWWRFGQPVTTRAAATYIVCLGCLFAATVLIWQLASIAAAAVLFHAAGFVFMVLAWREGREILRFGRQAPNPSIERTSSSKLRLRSAAAHVKR